MLRAWDSVEFAAMLTMFGEDGQRSRSHGLRPDVIAAQASRLGLEPLSAQCSWETYTDRYVALLAELAPRGITHVVFGDIAGDAHRAWNERVCAAHGLTPVMPLWNCCTADLVREFIAVGGEARLVTVRPPLLGQSWLGAALTEETVLGLESLGVDPCGELGEYHSLVINCPRFSSPLPFVTGEKVISGGCWALDVRGVP
jgi:diphthine-ammonia ligase